MDLAGEVDVAGVLWTIVGHLAVAAGEQCTQAAIPAIVPLVLPPELSRNGTATLFSLCFSI